jgi:hypothetical protein
MQENTTHAGNRAKHVAKVLKFSKIIGQKNTILQKLYLLFACRVLMIAKTRF